MYDYPAFMQDIIVTASVIIPASELSVSTSKASGPGGQHVNTTNSRVTLRYCPATSQALTDAQKERVQDILQHRLTKEGELLISCDTGRSQCKNRDEACGRLAALLRAALVPKKARRATRPTKASKLRRLNTKKARGNVKKMRRAVRDE